MLLLDGDFTQQNQLGLFHNASSYYISPDFSQLLLEVIPTLSYFISHSGRKSQVKLFYKRSSSLDLWINF